MSSLIAVSGDGVTVDVDGFSPSPALVTATGFVTINSEKVVVEGDSVSSHTNTSPDPDVVHSGATMVSSQQSFVKISNVNVIVENDSSSCSSSHVFDSPSIQYFVFVS